MPHETEVEVAVNYAGTGQPFKQDYAANTPLSQVKADVLEAFGLAESSDDAGNQTVYVFRKGNDRVEDLTATVGEVAEGHRHLQLRLVREVVAGER